MSLPWFIEKPNPEIYFTGSYLVFDLETTNKDKGDARNNNNHIVSIHCYSSKFGYDRLHRDRFNILIDYVLAHDFVVCHNTKFELKWLRRLGVPLEKILPYCTMLGEYVIAGNRGWALDLDSVAKRYKVGGKKSLVSLLIDGGVCPSEISESLLNEYGDQDVNITHKIFLRQRQKLKEMGLLNIAYLRNLITPALADIEMNGMFLDEELVYCLDEKIRKEYNEVTAKLNQFGNINWSSGHQKAHLIYGVLGFKELTDRKGKPIRNAPNKQFPDGMPKTDADTLEQLKATNNTQRRFVELLNKQSKLSKQLSTYVNRFLDACVFNDCVLTGNLNQSIAGSHRLTSSNPNLQNIDRTLKKVVTARKKEWGILSGDYKQLEFRAAALMAQDKVAYEDIYVEKIDVHNRTSNKLTESGQPTNRHDSKEHTFKPLYGGTSGTKAEQAYYNWFKARYIGIDSMHNRWIEEVLSTGKLKTPTGLIFYWPDTSIGRTGYINNNESIRNYPVQMLATADIAPMGTTLLWHRLKLLKLQSFIINLVHDSTITEVLNEERDIVGNLLNEAMSKDIVWFFKALFNIDINYPLEVETKFKSHWDWSKEETK